MGRKIVSLLFGGLSRKKRAGAAGDDDHKNPETENPDFPSPTPGGDAAISQNLHLSSAGDGLTSSRHTRASSVPHHQKPHHRSNSVTGAASKLVHSLSTGVLGSAAARRRSGDNRDKDKEKKLEHEDSIWKKTIILGEKCRVPEEDDDTILYDENGNRISSYHQRKSTSSLMTFSRQNSENSSRNGKINISIPQRSSDVEVHD